MAKHTQQRCDWCRGDELYEAYHDEEWGVPLHDDRKLFEFLILEGAQAGLSWITVLRKRENYRYAYWDFDPEKMASFGKLEKNKLLNNEGIIRNRLKIDSAINNAQRF
ncbi:MAG: DNA-3-methyladenine glycosylase I, partial [Planctomycetaceae bacterium]